jgi:hypothetical protein
MYAQLDFFLSPFSLSLLQAKQSKVFGGIKLRGEAMGNPTTIVELMQLILIIHTSSGLNSPL